MLVEVTVLLQQSPAFDDSRVAAFRDALAYTCGVPTSSVVVISATVPAAARRSRAARAAETVVQVVAQVNKFSCLTLSKD